MLVHTLRVYSTVLVFKVKVGCSDHQHQLLQPPAPQPHPSPSPSPSLPAPSVPSSPHHPWSLSVSFCFLNAAPVQERLSFPKVVRSAYWSGCRFQHRIRKVELQVSTLYFRRSSSSSSAAAAAAAAVPAAVPSAVSATATATAQAMFSAPERGVFRRFAFETPFHPKLWTASLCLHDLL